MPESITSLKNPKVKAAIQLRNGRHRRRHGRLLIDGVRELRRALEGGIEIVELFVCHDLCHEGEAIETVREAAQVAARVYDVTPAICERMAYGQRAEGVVAVAIAPQRTLANLALPDAPLIAVVVGIEKPGNLGAIVRTADGAGLSAVVAADGGTDLYNPNAIRASLGAIFTLPVCSATSRETMDWLDGLKVNVTAACVEADRDYWEIDYTLPTALVLGSEDEGLPAEWHDRAIARVRLPMHGRVDSLNVSAAAAAMFYEALRQRSAGASSKSQIPNHKQ